VASMPDATLSHMKFGFVPFQQHEPVFSDVGASNGQPMDRQRSDTELEAEDVWLSLVQASMAFLDTDGVYGPTAERTRAAKHRLAAAVEEFSAYQDDLRRRPAPLIHRVK